MTRITDHDLAHHFEIALGVADLDMLADLQHPETHRRRTAILSLTGHLVARLDGFEISRRDGAYATGQASLFPDDLRPLC